MPTLICSMCDGLMNTEYTPVVSVMRSKGSPNIYDYYHIKCYLKTVEGQLLASLLAPKEGSTPSQQQQETVPYTQHEWKKDVNSVCGEIRRTLISKNKKYGGRSPLRCFEKYKVRGILVRLEDKLNRIENFLEQYEEGKEVDMEVIRDAFRDIAGYAVSGTIIVKELYNG